MKCSAAATGGCTGGRDFDGNTFALTRRCYITLVGMLSLGTDCRILEPLGPFWLENGFLDCPGMGNLKVGLIFRNRFLICSGEFVSVFEI